MAQQPFSSESPQPPDAGRCDSCGATLPARAPQGLCPSCLLKRGLESHTTGFTADASIPLPSSRWTPPSVEELTARFPEVEISHLLGRGGMGAVYQARQKNLDRVVALKILPPEMSRDGAFAERFTREAQAMARLHHPHIVSIYEFGNRDGIYFFVMEFVDGLTLRRMLESGHMSPKEAMAIVPQICEALQYAHDQGIVHRDIKPENILLNKQGQVKIADFGLAKLVGQTTSATGPSEPAAHEVSSDQSILPGAGGLKTEHIMGTPAYMAPEQRSSPSEVDHRADIYALGVVFYQMLTGELPSRKQLEPPSRKVQIDVRLDEIVLRALEQKPERRYQQASEVKTQIETVVNSQIVVGTPDVPRSSPTVLDADDNLLPRLVAGWFVAAVVLLLAFCALKWGFLSLQGLMTCLWLLLPSGILIGRDLSKRLKVARSFSSPVETLDSYKSTDRRLVVKFVVMYVTFLGFLLGTVTLMPENIAWYFDWQGNATGDRTMKHGDYVRFLISVTGLTVFPFILVSELPRYLPFRRFILPRHEYWLAPEHRLHYKSVVTQYLVGGGGVLMLYLAGHHVIRLAAHLTSPTTKIATTPLLVLEIGFFAAFVVGFSGFLVRLAEPDRPAAARWRNRIALALAIVTLSLTIAGVWIPHQFPVWAPQATGLIRSSEPKSEELVTDHATARLVHDNVDLQYAIFYAGRFGYGPSSSYTLNQTWIDLGTIVLPNRRTFGFRRESGRRDILNINGQDFNLRAGRVLVLQDDGTTQQTKVFPTLDEAQDLKGLAKLIATFNEQSESPQRSGKDITRQKPTPAQLAEPPRLRFLDWDEADRDGAKRPFPRPWMPDGQPVVNPDELRLYDGLNQANFGLVLVPDKSRWILRLWYLHPAFDSDSLHAVEFLGPDLQPISSLFSHTAWASGMPEPSTSSLGWVCQRVWGWDSQSPRVYTIRVRYGVGPWSRGRPLNPQRSNDVYQGYGAVINGMGQNAEGRATLVMTVDLKQASNTQFFVEGMLKNGLSIRNSGTYTNHLGKDRDVTVRQLTFDKPLSEIAYFTFLSRPIRTIDFPNVVLPPLPSSSATPTTAPATQPAAAASTPRTSLEQARSTSEAFLRAVTQGNDDAIRANITTDYFQSHPKFFEGLAKVRTIADLSTLQLDQVLIADNSQPNEGVAVSSVFGYREHDRRGAFGLSLRREGNQWLVRNTRFVPEDQVRRFLDEARPAQTQPR